MQTSLGIVIDRRSMTMEMDMKPMVMARVFLTALKNKLDPRSSEGMLITSFLAVILIGTFLLALPFSHNGNMDFLKALFTSTSAVCVTGLAVVDTGTEFTLFGQVVILMLIQIGGLGVLTFATITMNILGDRLSLNSEEALQDSFLQRSAAFEFRRVFFRILKTVFIIEAAGVLLLWAGFAMSMGIASGFWPALFHSISAFCNAGFSLFSDSIVSFRNNPLILFTIMFLIIAGGIGHSVIVELWQFYLNPQKEKGYHRLSLHTRLVLITTAILIVSGTFFLFIGGMTSGESSLTEQFSGSLFQSVTARTAGFNSVDTGKLPNATLFILIILMFIGGSPASCAGGIKTTTAAIWFAKTVARIRGLKDPVIFERHIPGAITRRVGVIMTLAVGWNVAGIFILLLSERTFSMSSLVFEQISAFGTVGLSTGITPQLSATGKLWIILTMFAGRVGILTIVMSMMENRRSRIRYPQERVMIG